MNNQEIAHLMQVKAFVPNKNLLKYLQFKWAEDMKEKYMNIFEILKCSVLIAGTCIGGGMLALPLSIGSFGFLPSVALMFVACVFMSISSLLYLEATL